MDWLIIATLGSAVGCVLIVDCGSLADCGPDVTLETVRGWVLVADCGLFPTLGAGTGCSCTGSGLLVACLKMVASCCKASICLSPI